MDAESFQALIDKLATAATRREAVKSLVGGALASLGVVTVAAAKKGGKSKKRKGKGRGKKRKGGNNGKAKNRKGNSRDQESAAENEWFLGRCRRNGRNCSGSQSGASY